MNRNPLFLAAAAIALLAGCDARSKGGPSPGADGPGAQDAVCIGPLCVPDPPAPLPPAPVQSPTITPVVAPIVDLLGPVFPIGSIAQVCIGSVCVDLSLGPVAFLPGTSSPLPAVFPPDLAAPLVAPPWDQGSGGGGGGGGPPPPSGCAGVTQAMKVLVLSADGKEADLPAIQQALDYHGVPYTTWVASQNPGQLTRWQLAHGCDGQYQGIVLATGALAWSPDGGTTWQSALTGDEWGALRDYEAYFGVRELSWYVNPGPAQGLTTASAAVDTSQAPIDAWLTSAGQGRFDYVNAANPIPITYAWTYLARPASGDVTTLLQDSAGDALISTRGSAWGHETMAVTFDSNPYLLHDLALAHGLVEWVTKGVYLGEFRAYLTPQVDDLLIDDDVYGGGTYRISAVDFAATGAWQQVKQLQEGNDGFRLAFAFNGSGGSLLDPLTAAVRAANGDFLFINHTFDHENLDAVGYDLAYDQIDRNDAFGTGQGYVDFYPENFVSPDVSGLENPDAMQAEVDAGVRFAVSDTSRPGWDNPAPNIGIYSRLQPSLLLVPRRPTNLFYNVTTPTEWAAEYNSFYASYWGRNLSYSEILDKESQILLFYMLRGEIDPQMYHQSNLRAYDGVHSLLSDLLDRAIQKYRRLSTLPARSPDLRVAGARMASAMARNASGLSAVLTPGSSVTFTSPVALEFPVSGVCTGGSERYAGKCITRVSLRAGEPATLPVQ